MANRKHKKANKNVLTFERVKDACSFEAYAAARLTETDAKGRYVCPACGSGSGPHGTSAVRLFPKGNGAPKDSWYCYACHAGGDVFELARYCEPAATRHDQLLAVAEFCGLIEPDGSARADTRAARFEREARRRERERQKEAELAAAREVQARNREVYARHRAAALARPADPEAVAYWQTRGIGPEVCARWGLTVAYTDKHGNRRAMIPYPGSAHYYIGRDMGGEARAKYEKPGQDVVGKEPLWNPRALDGDLVVIVEGPLDAIAVTESGFPCIALVGTGHDELLAESMVRAGFDGAAVIMLDADHLDEFVPDQRNPGEMKRETSGGAYNALKLGAYLGGEGDQPAHSSCSPFLFTFWPWDDEADRPRYKDANEWWQADPDGLREALAAACELARMLAAARKGVTAVA